MELGIPGTRRLGLPKKTWHQQTKDDMTGVGFEVIVYAVKALGNHWNTRYFIHYAQSITTSRKVAQPT